MLYNLSYQGYLFRVCHMGKVATPPAKYEDTVVTLLQGCWYRFSVSYL